MSRQRAHGGASGPAHLLPDPPRPPLLPYKVAGRGQVLRPDLKPENSELGYRRIWNLVRWLRKNEVLISSAKSVKLADLGLEKVSVTDVQEATPIAGVR